MEHSKKIHHLRKQIDSIDNRIVELLIERFGLSKKIGKLKSRYHISIDDPDRESEIIDRLTDYLEGRIERQDIAAIFTPVYQVSKKYQTEE